MEKFRQPVIEGNTFTSDIEVVWDRLWANARFPTLEVRNCKFVDGKIYPMPGASITVLTTQIKK